MLCWKLKIQVVLYVFSILHVKEAVGHLCVFGNYRAIDWITLDLRLKIQKWIPIMQKPPTHCACEFKARTPIETLWQAEEVCCCRPANEILSRLKRILRTVSFHNFEFAEYYRRALFLLDCIPKLRSIQFNDIASSSIFTIQYNHMIFQWNHKLW